MEKEEASSETRVALIAMDGSQDSEKAFNFYLADLHRPGDHAILLHIVHHGKGHNHGSIWMPVDQSVVTTAHHAENEKANQTKEKLKELLENARIDGDIRLAHGEPGHVIVKAAEELKAAFVVTGCRGHGKIRRTILGSVSDFVLHHSHVPVFICKH